MPKIDDLMHGKKPGEIKVCTPSHRGYFQPFYKTNGNLWCGLDEAEDSSVAGGSEDKWHLYTEPKKKVKRWLWAKKGRWGDTNEPCWEVMFAMRTEEEARTLLGVVKLPWSETEFEE